jgi:hypothetical protein
MADKSIWWSLQPLLDDEDMPPMDPVTRRSALEVFAETDNAYNWRGNTRSRLRLVPMFSSVRMSLLLMTCLKKP